MKNKKQYLVVFHDEYLDGGLFILVVNHANSKKDAINKAFSYNSKSVKFYDYVWVDEINSEYSVVQWMSTSCDINASEKWNNPNPYKKEKKQ